MATTKPVHILLIGMETTPELEALVAEGHTVHTYSDGHNLEWYDLVLGPKCWRIGPQHMKFLPLAIKEARAAMLKRKKKA